MERKKHYYEYCDKTFPNVRQLNSSSCSRHPDGYNKDHHKLYESNESVNTSASIAARHSPPS